MEHLPLRSRFVYDDNDWETSLPVMPWDRVTSTVGGHRKSASGVPAAYVVRRDHVLRLTLRFRESEWEEIHRMIRWGQGGETITWYPDALVPGESFNVYLESPLAGEDISPSRSSSYPRVLELAIGLRRADGSAWGIDYFGLD